MNHSSKQFLVEIPNLHSIFCYQKAYIKSGGSVDASGSFWTSGTDLGCSGSFAWCSARKIFYNSKWTANQPADSNEAQCVAIKLDVETALLEATICADAKKFICEVRIFCLLNLKMKS
jgi:hypothetical protein